MPNFVHMEYPGRFTPKVRQNNMSQYVPSQKYEEEVHHIIFIIELKHKIENSLCCASCVNKSTRNYFEAFFEIFKEDASNLPVDETIP